MALADERAKAEFLADYRRICERHGMMVITVENEEGTYLAFSAARMESKELDTAIQEMLLEPLRTMVSDG